MATAAGLIPIVKDIVAVAGAENGGNTVLRIKLANAASFDRRIKKVIAKSPEF